MGRFVQRFPAPDKKDAIGHQKKAAEALGVSGATISAILSGDASPGAALILRLADGLGESVDAVVGRQLPRPATDLEDARLAAERQLRGVIVMAIRARGGEG